VKFTEHGRCCTGTWSYDFTPTKKKWNS